MFENCSSLGQEDFEQGGPYFEPYHMVADVAYSEGYMFTTDPSEVVCGSQSSVYQWGYSLLVIYVLSFHGRSRVRPSKFGSENFT